MIKRQLTYPVLKQDLPSYPHALFNEPLEKLFEYYKEHIKRDIQSGRLHPQDFWTVARFFLISGIQTYAAILLLLQEKRPKRLMLQAGILNRSLLETLANV